jgi:hypothetical protein
MAAFHATLEEPAHCSDGFILWGLASAFGIAGPAMDVDVAAYPAQAFDPGVASPVTGAVQPETLGEIEDGFDSSFGLPKAICKISS